MMQNELNYACESAWDLYGKENNEKIFAFSQTYKQFLNRAKTEREFVAESVAVLERNGFVNADHTAALKAGDKVYRIIRGKGLVASVIGTEPMVNGLNVLGAHIDSPRIDLKPIPVYEDGEMAFFKTHYYGGIKKYQWTTTPLAIHGVMYNKAGEKIDICVGESKDDPVFTINELLIHLSEEQLARTAADAIKGEELNLLVGGIPCEDKEAKSRVKTAVLALLNEKYGITEKDFITAELSLVPAQKAKDVGFDRAFVGGYGQDDRVCGFTSLAAILAVENPARTSVCILTDKEEVGSMGSTGAQSRLYENALMELMVKSYGKCTEWEFRNCLANSFMLSSDVSSAFDPTFGSAHDKMNATYAGKGLAIMKYVGAKGKGGSNDANSEYFHAIVDLFDKNNVPWQTGEIGRVDLGGGGTIAAFMANMGMDVIDCGVPVLSMHSTFEVTSKVDIYSAYEAYLTFLMCMR